MIAEKVSDPLRFMKEALKQAKKAMSIQETPIGAVIVRDGKILARGYNLRETRQDVTLHAEMIAIRKACLKLGSWRLDDCDLYVTLEPCAMCAGAIQQARMARVFFGAADPKAGAVVSRMRFFDMPGMNHEINYEGGLMAEESSALLRGFFTRLRQIDKTVGTKGKRRELSKSQNLRKRGSAEAVHPGAGNPNS